MLLLISPYLLNEAWYEVSLYYLENSLFCSGTLELPRVVPAPGHLQIVSLRWKFLTLMQCPWQKTLVIWYLWSLSHHFFQSHQWLQKTTIPDSSAFCPLLPSRQLRDSRFLRCLLYFPRFWLPRYQQRDQTHPQIVEYSVFKTHRDSGGHFVPLSWRRLHTFETILLPLSYCKIPTRTLSPAALAVVPPASPQPPASDLVPGAGWEHFAPSCTDGLEIEEK